MADGRAQTFEVSSNVAGMAGVFRLEWRDAIPEARNPSAAAPIPPAGRSWRCRYRISNSAMTAE